MRLLRTFLVAAVLLCAGPPVSASLDADFPGLNVFIDEMAAKHGFERAELERLFSGIRMQPGVIERISSPWEAKPWYQYRPIFLTESRIADGVAFMREHAATLQRAAREYGVPAEIIAAILGVETRFGRHQGRDTILESLATLAFRYPQRAAFFRGELEAFLLLARDEHLDPLTLTGSYAGAMGLPQFIASSYRHYAVDFDGDGRRDLIDSVPDAIGSVANYLARHGWAAGRPVALPAVVPDGADRGVIDGRLKPHVPLAELHRLGYRFTAPGLDDELSAPLSFELEQGEEVWLGLQNFYAITRYNHSPLYALAVFQLAQALRAGTETPGTAD